MIKFIQCTVFVCITSLLAGCPFDHDDQHQKGSYKVIAHPIHTTNHLYYSGTIQPLVTTTALSPVDGRITTVLFNYGDQIQKGKKLVLINSTQLADDYHQTVNAFLEKKDAMNHQAFLFKGTSKLWEAQVIAKDQFITGKSTLETSKLEYFQAKYELEKVLKKADINPSVIENLTLDKTDAINQILQKQFSAIPVLAGSSGVALFPLQSANAGASTEDDQKIAVGQEVKTGQLILSIGDQAGLSTDIQVSEVDINRIKVGMPVTVTGDAFPDISLSGRIQSIAAQAQINQSMNTNIGQFDVVIAMPKISQTQKDQIHVGMSCKVDIAIDSPSHIMLPIAAVWQKGAQSYVTIIDPVTQKKLAIPVTTGHTTPTSVAILTGIKLNDEVIVHDPTEQYP